jgi:hypothetical protein
MRPFVCVMALLTSACATSGWHRLERDIAIRALHPPATWLCADGRPVRVLVDLGCAMGVCGWTCAPDRWPP